mmetsp:Transcript_34408/g.70272  ORF Transcript_34408/g.70272 Transcript_34408/m.70272 type:complete len:334 (+) Transcript_34408:1655-2656(+)
MRVCKDWHPHEYTFFHCMVYEAFKWTQRLFESLTGKAQGVTPRNSGDIRNSRFSSEQSPFTKPVARSKDLVHILAIAKTNIMHLYLAISHDVEHLTNIAFVNDTFPIMETDGCQRICNPRENIILKFRQEGNLPHDILDVLLLVGLVVGKHVTESFLINLPQTAIGVCQASGSTGAIVEQRKLSKGSTTSARSDMVAIHSKAHMTLLHNVEIITNVPLLNDDCPCWNRVQHHGINQKAAFFRTETGKDEVVSQRCVNKFDSLLRLRKVGDSVVITEVDGLSENILCTLCLHTAVNVLHLFAANGVMLPSATTIMRSLGRVHPVLMCDRRALVF